MHDRLLRLDRLALFAAASRVHGREAQAASDIPRLHVEGRSARLTAERITLLRERVRSGVYHSAGYADDIARRILASGDL